MCTLNGFNTITQDVDEKYAWINDMIIARQKLVVLFMKLSNAPSDESIKDEELDIYSNMYTQFREHLIDYLSHGHFNLYPKIIELMEKAEYRSISIANKVLPKIEETTQKIMDITDKYEDNDKLLSIKILKQDLNNICKSLNTHFRFEDRLIIGLRLINSIVSLKNNEN